ncbi:MAG: hypothetical protein SCH98_15435 [Deferrisomatales bacterium]|nr:hypothetical protein [Deferrisomatales bacterium]
MRAVKTHGCVTADHRLVVSVPKGVEPGPVEVIVLQESDAGDRDQAFRRTDHPAFGIWADRAEAADPVDLSARLREEVETRRDRRDG